MGLRVQDLLDILVVASLFYATITWLRRTHAAFVLIGIAILGGLYVLARVLELHLTTWIFQGFFAVFLVMIVVIFQEELRQVFERIARWSLRRDRTRPQTPLAVVDSIVSTIAALARERVGALIVIPGRDSVERHVHGGIVVGGRLSEPLLRSLFDPHSPGHDGAVIVDGDRITRFAVHLPLSKDDLQLRGVGTRHAAALGLAELTDALSIVVSEERGEVSIAHEGRLVRLRNPQEAGGRLQRFLEARQPAAPEDGRFLRLLRENSAEKGLALAAALAVWALFVPVSQNATETFTVPVSIENLPSNLALEGYEPETVEVTLAGSRGTLFFLDPNQVRVTVDASLAALGRRTFRLAEPNVSAPRGIYFETIEPDTVKIRVK